MGTARAAGLLLGVLADSLVREPRRLHPVAGFRQLATRLERSLYADHRMAGVLYAGTLIGGAVVLGIGAERLSRRHGAGQLVTTAATAWVVLGGASLATEGSVVARALDAGDLATARERLPLLCRRDPEQLDAPGLARAGVEAVAESTSDAVVGPLLWGTAAGIPGLLAYRAAHTLDVLVGYRAPRYRRFGWAAARLDDLMNVVPARVTAVLTAVFAPVVGGSAAGAWEARRRDALAHPSPNAGQIEAAFAGALEIRLGGRTVYADGAAVRPVLGEGRSPDAGDLTRGVELSRVVGAAAAALSAAAAIALRRRRHRRG